MKSGKLVLKGEKPRHRKRSRKRTAEAAGLSSKGHSEETKQYGGWWAAENIAELTGNIVDLSFHQWVLQFTCRRFGC